MDSKVKTPGKTPKSAKKNDKSVKTPASKNAPMADTPRPVLSAKKQNGVQLAGKPTPNKKGNITPGNKKTPKSEQKKKGKTPVKKVEEEEEDDDDEDDDDSEIEFNPEIMKKLAAMEDDDDDDDEDMDDDDEDDDDEDDDEDDDDEDEDGDDLMDEEQLKMLIKSLKEKKKKTTNGEKATPVKKEAAKEPAPAKGGKKAKAAPAPAPAPKKEAPAPKKEAPAPKKEAPAPKKEDKKPAAAPAKVSATEQQQIKSVCERDMRTLFLKGLPTAIQDEEIKKLSPDILALRLRKRIRRDAKKTAIYAFVEFESEAIAEKNFEILSKTKVGGKDIFVDYMGKKSVHRPNKPPVIKELDPKKLYITGFPCETTELEMKQMFPKASEVILLVKGQSKKPLGFAFAKFDDADVCADEMKRLNGKSFKGSKLVVLYANLVTDAPKPKAQKRKTDTKTGNAKKAKVEVEEDDDDEDDDDEDDEDDDDDDEEDDDDDDEDDDDDDEE